MKTQIITAGCMLLAIAGLAVSFITKDLLMSELCRGSAVVLLLIGMKYLYQADFIDNR